MAVYLVNYGGCRGKTAMATAMATATATSFASTDPTITWIEEIGDYFMFLYETCPEFTEWIDMGIVETEKRLAKRELFREKSSSYNRKCKNTILARNRKRWNIANNLHRNSFQREGRR